MSTKSPLRVLMVSGSFRDRGDGLARTLHRLSKTLDEHGIEHFVFAPMVDELQRPTLHVRQVSSLPLLQYPAYRVSVPLPRLVRQFDEARCQVVHISTPDYLGLFALLYAKRRRLPVVAVYHTNIPQYFRYYASLFFLEPLYWLLLKWFYRACDLVMVPSAASRDFLKKMGAGGRRGIRIWSRGVDHALFGPHRRDPQIRRQWGIDDDTLCLVFLGRLVWYKDLEVFRQVYHKLSQRFHFVLIGEGPALESLQATMPRATFMGHLSGETLSRSLASGDILLFPSVTETFGNAVLEALACGLPAVVSDVGGPADIVRESGAGLVAPGGDVQAFADAVVRLADDPALFQRCRQAGLDHASHQHWPEVNQVMLEVYRELAELA